jgi:DNA (cytosine-5)-methyltransferase 1
MTNPKAIDLFCGCGGISSGLERSGFEILAGIDIEKVFLQSYELNFPHAVTILQDLALAEPTEVMEQIGIKRGKLDLLAGGPPCQGFSKNVPRKNRYLEDPKNKLVRAFLNMAKYIMPRYILMENVAEMQNGFEQAYTNLIVELLESYGYSVSYNVLYAPDFGVPQRRRRAFFLASRDTKSVSFPMPTHFNDGGLPNLFDNKPYVTVWDAIGDLPQLEHGEGEDPTAYNHAPFHSYQEWARYGSDRIYNHVARHLQPTQYARLSSIAPGQTLQDLPEKLRPKSGYSGAYGRLTKEMLAPTITRWVFHPGSGRFGHPVTPRVITIREAARLQAFPDTFRFTGTYIQQSHQVGNAVPPLLSETIGRALLSSIGSACN